MAALGPVGPWGPLVVSSQQVFVQKYNKIKVMSKVRARVTQVATTLTLFIYDLMHHQAVILTDTNQTFPLE